MLLLKAARKRTRQILSARFREHIEGRGTICGDAFVDMVRALRVILARRTDLSVSFDTYPPICADTAPFFRVPRTMMQCPKNI